MTSVEDEIKKEIMLWVKRVDVPWTKREAVDGRGVCLGLTVANGSPISSRLTESEKTWIRGMNRWLKRKLIEAKMEGFSWSSIEVNVNTVARWHVGKNNEGPSVITTVGDLRAVNSRSEERMQ